MKNCLISRRAKTRWFIDLNYAWVYLVLGIIMYPVINANGQTVMAPAYSPGSFPQYISYLVNYPNQAVVSQSAGETQVVSSTPYNANQVVLTEASVVGSVQDTAIVTYSGQEPPPAYQERQQPFHAS